MTKDRPHTVPARRPQTPDPKDVVCPHQHFKYDIIDRDILSRKQHLNLLCTPKGYRWVVVKSDPLDLTPDEAASHICRVAKKKPGKTYVHNILAELWNLLTPEMVNRLKEMLMVEFGLSEEAAIDIICHSRHDTLQTAHRRKSESQIVEDEDDDFTNEEDPTQPRLIVEPKLYNKSKFAVGIDPCHIREFSRIVSTKFSEYVVAMMCARRNNRHRRMAEVVLNGLCELTGENTSLDNPKNRLHKILAIASDRVALWLAQNMDNDDLKRDRRRKKEDEALRKKRKEKQKEQDTRRKEKERMNKDIEKNKKRREKDEEEEERKKQEEQEKKNAEKEKRRQDNEKFREQDKKKRTEEKNKGKEDEGKKKAGQKKKGDEKGSNQKPRPKSAQAGGDHGGGGKKYTDRTKKSGTKSDGKGNEGARRSQQKTTSQKSSGKKSEGTAASQPSRSSAKTSTSRAGAGGGSPAKSSQPVDASEPQRASVEKKERRGASSTEESPAGGNLGDGGPSNATDNDQSVADSTPSQPAPSEGTEGIGSDGPQPNPGAPPDDTESQIPAGTAGAPAEGTESRTSAGGSGAPVEGSKSQEPVAAGAPVEGSESQEPVLAAVTSKPAETMGPQTGDTSAPTAAQSEVPIKEGTQQLGEGPETSGEQSRTPEKSIENKIIEATTSQIGSTKTISTPRQETLQDILNKELEKRIQPKDKSTADVIKEVASKTATWIDQNVKDAEIEYGSRDLLPRVPPVSQKPKGPLYVLRKIPADDTYEVSISSYTEAGEKIRPLRRHTSGRNVNSAPTDPRDPKMWAKWAENASEMADDWGHWIDKTIQDAEDKAVQYHAKAKEGTMKPADDDDWNRFVEATNKDALTWRRMKKSFDEAAKEWKFYSQ